MKNKLILHAIICHKPYFKSKEEALTYRKIKNEYAYPLEITKKTKRLNGGFLSFNSFILCLKPLIQFL